MSGGQVIGIHNHAGRRVGDLFIEHLSLSFLHERRRQGDGGQAILAGVLGFVRLSSP